MWYVFELELSYVFGFDWSGVQCGHGLAAQGCSADWLPILAGFPRAFPFTESPAAWLDKDVNINIMHSDSPTLPLYILKRSDLGWPWFIKWTIKKRVLKLKIVQIPLRIHSPWTSWSTAEPQIEYVQVSQCNIRSAWMFAWYMRDCRTELMVVIQQKAKIFS